MLKLFKEFFPIVFVVFFLMNNGIFSQKLPELIPIKVDGQFGYCDSNKKIIIEPRFDDAYPFGINEIACIIKDNKLGAINKEGKLFIEPNCKDIDFYIKSKDKWVALIEQENFLKKKVSNNKNHNTKQRSYKKENKQLINQNGDVILQNFSKIKVFMRKASKDMIIAYKNIDSEKFNLINHSGKLLAKAYDEILMIDNKKPLQNPK